MNTENLTNEKGGASEVKTFHLGLTMAGAVSAGAYTAGVMDYLFEILELWEKAKQGLMIPEELKDVKIPNHNVVIDAMGGASAGGMTTCMAAIYGLMGKIEPVLIPLEKLQKEPTGNLLYDSWVRLVDTDQKTTLQKALDTDDLESEGKVVSLLNSKFIDEICDQALAMPTVGNIAATIQNKPRYIADDLEIILSHCSLRGIPLGVEFKTEIASAQLSPPANFTYDHFTYSHFKLNSGKPISANDQSFSLNPYDQLSNDRLKLCAMATGAFPIGLKFRNFNDKFRFTNDYIQDKAEKVISGVQPEVKLAWDKDRFPTNFDFVSVDGGTVNNEPFGEVLKLLKNKNPYFDKEGKYNRYAMIMIDPFPDFFNLEKEEKYEDGEKYVPPTDIFDAARFMYGTLRDQSIVKRVEVLSANMNKEYIGGEIFPKKWDKYMNPVKYPIACGSVGAFGGFMDYQFREHDFFLGRNNARNYFRRFFTVKYDPDHNIVHPIHEGWSDEAIRLLVQKEKEPSKKKYLPIIPDLNLMIDRKKNVADKQTFDPESDGAYKYTVLEKPTLNPESVFELRDLMDTRFEKILHMAYHKYMDHKPPDTPSLKPKETPKPTPISDKWMGKYTEGWFKRKIWEPLKGFGLKKILKSTTPSQAGILTKIAIEWILKDLETRNS
ncbi:MAG: patatin-like phospholipase family protein [Saprospiraceae bacterium]|nr:patatin-like phospholipase family protein [Candidatus Defluviibacterium haderslevense]